MALPVNGEGRFVAVDGDDTVQGRGLVRDGWVEFWYGDVAPDATPPGQVGMSEVEFEEVWVSLPQSQHLTVQAAA